MGEYIPSAPASDEARKRNGNLPGMGGVYNYVNFHVYHYAGNNPVKYIDPDGRHPAGLTPRKWKEKVELNGGPLISPKEIEILRASKDDLHFGDPLMLMHKTSSFGLRTDAKPKNHEGIDLRAKVGTPVYASESGTVTTADLEYAGSTGKNSYLVIDHGKGWKSRYLHMDSFVVKVGDEIKKGVLVGYTGTRKNVAPHLHSEILKNNIKKDPELFLREIPGER
jgi:murein DD-endopeptidase MepM/ murein hydrolase activator NlpD